MKNHLNFIIIGAAMGIVPALIILVIADRIGWLEWVIFSTLAGGVTGSIGGWIGGAISKRNWGAVLGGLVGTIIGVLSAGMPQ